MMLAKNKDQWESLGDEVATSIMTKGYKPSLKSIPELTLQPPSSKTTSQKTITDLEEFIPNWLKRGIIREITAPTLLHFSRIFIRLKKNGKKRPIIDLKVLNNHLNFPSFKMETVSVIAKAISTGLWACSVDIQDAYFHVPMHWEFHKFLAFKIGNRIFVFQFLPFGLSPAPWVFTRIIKPIKSRLHTLMILIFSYLDDFILFAKTAVLLSDSTKTTLKLLQSLGFAINWEKSSLTPAQEVEFLGVSWDLKNGTLSVPQEKRNVIVARCHAILNETTATRRSLESLAGLLNFAATYIQLGRLHLLPIIAWMNLSTLCSNRDTPVLLTPRFKSLVRIWTKQEFLSRCVPMNISHPDISMMTDASLDGWCGVLLPRKVLGTWSPDVQHNSMNWKELMAVCLSLRKFRSTLSGKTVRVLSDNTTTVCCLRRQGSLKSEKLHSLTTSILEFCRANKITLVPEHLRGVMNVLADQGSRLKPVSTEWTLDRLSFNRIAEVFPGLQVDLFATRFNAQLETFVSPYPDDQAAGCDAFALDWDRWRSIYLFPPRSVLPQVVQRLQTYKGRGVLLAPYWPSQSWFPILLSRCRSDPIKLPRSHSLSQMTLQGLTWADTEFWNLHVWPL